MMSSSRTSPRVRIIRSTSCCTEECNTICITPDKSPYSKRRWPKEGLAMKAKESKIEKSSANSSPAASPQKRFSGIIRAPREEDHAGLADLAGQLSYPSTPQEISHRLAGMANSNEHAVFVAEMPGGEIAGWIAVFTLRGLEVDPRGEISGFLVDERFRSQAVGKPLLAPAA